MKRRGARGFTLVEVLVAFALFSLVMLALGASLRSVAQTEERLDRQLNEADRVRVASGFLRTALGRVFAQRPQRATRAGESQFLFIPRPQSLEWVGVMPARHGAGGRTYFRLAPEPVQGTTALVIRFAPWDSAAAFPDWTRAESRVLVPELAGLQLLYCQADAVAAGCAPTWTLPDRLPGRVRLSIQDHRGAWPDMVVTLHVPGARGGGAGGGFTLGPE